MNKYPAAMYVRTFTVTAITDPPTDPTTEQIHSGLLGSKENL